MSIDGWYLMTTEEVVREAANWRNGSPDAFANAHRLSIKEALARRNAGNLPDETGRSLRLVIEVEDDAGVDDVAARRVELEPDFHTAPGWRRQGSQPVNVVPLRRRGDQRHDHEAWWEDEKIAPLEAEWVQKGTVAGLPVPGEYRGFVYKTVIALNAAGHEVTADAVADSVARWLEPDDVARLRAALGQGKARDPQD